MTGQVSTTERERSRFPVADDEELWFARPFEALEIFDVLLLENLYGDIVSDLAAGLVGGLGLVPGANLGKDLAIFEAVHGTAPDIAGTGKANPTALLMSSVLMLRHLGQAVLATAIESALFATLAAGIRTPDLGGTASTTDFAKAVAERLGG